MSIMTNYDSRLVRRQRARIDELEEEVRQLREKHGRLAIADKPAMKLTPGVPEAGRKAFNLTPVHSEILYYITLHPGAMVVSIASHIYGNYTQARRDCIQVHVCKMRKILEKKGITIIRAAGKGYDLSQAHRAVMRKVFAGAGEVAG